MAKFEVNDIVWVKRNNQSPEPYYWPAKVTLSHQDHQSSTTQTQIQTI